MLKVGKEDLWEVQSDGNMVQASGSDA